MSESKIFCKAGEYICKVCTNTSLAKYRYSFPKSSRFPGDAVKSKEEIKKEREEEKQKRKEDEEREKRGEYVKHDFYYLPSTLDKRFTRFGYGKRTDFTSKNYKNLTDAEAESDPITAKVIEKMNKDKITEPKDAKDLKRYYNSLMGFNFQSKFRSNEGRSFAGKYYPKDLRNDNPGPGAYISPSDFGIYQKEDKIEYKKKEYDDPKPWRHGMKKIKPKKEEDIQNYDDNQGIQEEETPEDVNENNEENKEDENKNDEQTPENENNEEKKEDENKNDEQENENKDEDKESECIMLKDILVYPEENKAN